MDKDGSCKWSNLQTETLLGVQRFIFKFGLVVHAFCHFASKLS